MDIKTIVAVGDSISNGYCDSEGGWLIRLIRKLNTQGDAFWSLNNFAISGDLVGDAWHNLCRNAIHRETDYLFLYIGANDIRRKGGGDSLMCSSPEARELYWERILTWANRAPQKLIVFGLLPVDEGKGAYECEDGTYFWSQDDALTYNTQIRDWAKQANMPFIDWMGDFASLTPLPDLMEDIVHPNAQGHERMAEIAYERLKDLM